MLSFFSQTNTTPETNDMVIIEDEETVNEIFNKNEEDKSILSDKTDMEIKAAENIPIFTPILTPIFTSNEERKEDIITKDDENNEEEENNEDDSSEEENNIYRDNIGKNLFQFLDDITSSKINNSYRDTKHTSADYTVSTFIIKVKVFINNEEYTQKFVCKDRKLICNIKTNIFNRIKADRHYQESYFKTKYDEYFYIIEEKGKDDDPYLTTLYGRYLILFGAFSLQDKLCEISIEKVNHAKNFTTRVMDLP